MVSRLILATFTSMTTALLKETFPSSFIPFTNHPIGTFASIISFTSLSAFVHFLGFVGNQFMVAAEAFAC